MKIKGGIVTVSRLIALAKYENVTYECSVNYDVEDGETPDEAYSKALDFCKEKVGAEVDRLTNE